MLGQKGAKILEMNQQKHVILDKSICLALLIGDKPIYHRQAIEVFSAIENKVVRADLSIVTLAELTHWLMETCSLSKRDFVGELRDLLSLKGIRIVEMKKRDCFDVLRRYGRSRLTFVESYIQFLSSRQKIEVIATGRASDFRKISSFTRIQKVQ